MLYLVLLTYLRPPQQHEDVLHANEDGCGKGLGQAVQSWNIEDSDKRLPIGNVPIAALETSLTSPEIQIS